jgi:AraC-like DNA-binding protein
MLVVDVHCTHPFESRLSGQDIVEFHYRLSGSIVIAGTWGELRVRNPASLIWYQPFGCDDAAERMGVRETGERDDVGRETWVSLYCDRAWLCKHTGRYATQLLDSLAREGPLSAGAPHFRLRPQHSDTIRIVGEVLRARGDSPLNWLYCTAKANELLYVSLNDAQQNVVDDHRVPHGSDSDQRLINQARDLLESQFAAPPRLSVLARRVGMNHTKLCALFKCRFGESVFDFVRRRRLEHAYDLLTQSGQQVRQVATAVGYRHHSTFTAAFTRHFGVTPKRARRTALAKDDHAATEALRR